MTALQEAIARVRADSDEEKSVSHDDMRLILTAAEEAEGLRAALTIADTLRNHAFFGSIGPYVDATIIQYDAARALTAAPQLKTTGDTGSESKTQAERSADSTGMAGVAKALALSEAIGLVRKAREEYGERYHALALVLTAMEGTGRDAAQARGLVEDSSQSSPERHRKHETKGVDAAPQGEKE